MVVFQATCRNERLRSEHSHMLKGPQLGFELRSPLLHRCAEADSAERNRASDTTQWVRGVENNAEFKETVLLKPPFYKPESDCV
jgi:hypothetical protein